MTLDGIILTLGVIILAGALAIPGDHPALLVLSLIGGGMIGWGGMGLLQVDR